MASGALSGHAPAMRAPDPTHALRSLAGIATRRDVVGLCGRRAVAKALDNGLIERPRRGWYAFPTLEPVLLTAERRKGVVSHESAAILWGLDVATRPERHHLTVGTRRLALGPGVTTHWADLAAHDVDHAVTTPVRTVLDCARTLPFREALVIADSALRTGQVSTQDLTSAAAALRGAGSARVRRVVTNADPRAESALESLLRGVLLARPASVTSRRRW